MHSSNFLSMYKKSTIFVPLLGIEILCMCPAKGLDPICDIKTLSARSREMESRCKVVEVYSVKKSYLNTQGISQTM